MIDKAYAQSVATALTGQAGQVIAFARKPEKIPPPLPFSLPELQKSGRQAERSLSRRTLDLAQSLYEKHQLLTYPRSDCPTCPRTTTLRPVRYAEGDRSDPGPGPSPGASDGCGGSTRHGRCWNDSKVTAHHAIIPTTRALSSANLSPDERFICSLVAHRYLLQFLPPRELQKTAVDIVVPTSVGDEAAGEAGLEVDAGWYAWRHALAVVDAAEKATDDPEEGGRRCLP